MNLKSIHGWMIVPGSVHFMFGTALLILQTRHGAGTAYDAGQYLSLAESGHAITAAHDTRLFGYPWFLSMVLSVSDFFNLAASPLLLVAQTVIYLVAASYLASSLTDTIKLRRTVFWVLCLNIFIAPYHSVALTDSLATSLALFAIGATANVLKTERPLANGFLLTFSIAFGITVRPALVFLAPLLILALIIVVLRRREAVKLHLVSYVFGLQPIAYQMFLNSTTFGSFSPLPYRGLGGEQLRWGLELLKYGTTIYPTPGGIRYESNALFINSAVDFDAPVTFYTSQPLLAFQLVFTKLVGAFDWDFLVPYVVNPHQALPPLGLITIAGLVFGLVFIVVAFVNRRQLLLRGAIPAVIFLGWSAVILPSAVELRFTLPLLTMFLATITVGVYEIWGISKRQSLLLIGAGVVITAALIPVALFVRAQMVLPVA